MPTIKQQKPLYTAKALFQNGMSLLISYDSFCITNNYVEFRVGNLKEKEPIAIIALNQLIIFYDIQPFSYVEKEAN